MEIKIDNLKQIERIDSFLTKIINISRSRIQSLIKEGKVFLNGVKAKKDEKVKNLDTVEIDYDADNDIVKPENIALDIIYEDDDILVINKPPGLIVHPAGRIKSGTLVNALLFYCSSLSNMGGDERPGLVHRLDKDTSGVMVVAKNNKAHAFLSKQFKDRVIKKKYTAIVQGCLKQEEKIETFYGRHPRERKKMSTWGGLDRGKKAITEIKILKQFKNATIVEAFPKTGRTHQIRVHLASIGYPIIADKVYGTGVFEMPNGVKLNNKRQMLHASSLAFMHPISGKFMEFNAGIPEDMKKTLEEIELGSK